MGSFGFGLNSRNITEWKSIGIYNHSSDSNMNAVADTKTNVPIFKNDGRTHVHLSGNHFQQNKVIIPNNNNIINIYCVYELDPIASTRDTSYTIQITMQITKSATDYDKNNYKGYAKCFDERSQFGHTITENGRAHTTNGRNVLIFGVDISFSAHATNRANHIYLMGGDKSYFFVNGRQELKFKAKTDQLVKEKLCIGNLSDQWTASESEKTGLYGNIYDFVVDYEQILGVKRIYDMRRYLMTKHNINP